MNWFDFLQRNCDGFLYQPPPALLTCLLLLAACGTTDSTLREAGQRISEEVDTSELRSLQ